MLLPVCCQDSYLTQPVPTVPDVTVVALCGNLDHLEVEVTKAQLSQRVNNAKLVS